MLAHRYIEAAPQSFDLTGQSVEFKRSLIVIAATEGFNLGAAVTSLLHRARIGADVGGFALDGADTSFVRYLIMAASSESFILGAPDAGLYRYLPVSEGTFILTGLAQPFTYRKYRKPRTVKRSQNSGKIVSPQAAAKTINTQRETKVIALHKAS